MNDQKILNLLRIRTAFQRQARSTLENLEKVENEIESEIALGEGRSPIKKSYRLVPFDFDCPVQSSKTN